MKIINIFFIAAQRVLPCLAVVMQATERVAMSSLIKHLQLGVLACLLLTTMLESVRAEVIRLVELKKIWSERPHSAFTDLIRFKDAFYIAFREGTSHVVPPIGDAGGDLRILRSEDGITWSPAGLLVGGIDCDFRDAKLTVTPKDQLMLGGARAPHAIPSSRQSMVWVSSDGFAWSEPVDIGEADYWLWGLHTYGRHIYSIGYGPLNNGSASNWSTRLYRSDGDAVFQAYLPTLSPQKGMSEGSLLFRNNGEAVALIRRDADSQLAMVGTSKEDFREWTWKKSDAAIGGPELIELPDGRIIAAGRRYEGGPHTSLSFLNLLTGGMTEILTLPSAGDSSYPGMVWHDERLWISYYSSHEGRAAIYLAQVVLIDE